MKQMNTLNISDFINKCTVKNGLCLTHAYRLAGTHKVV